MYEQEDTSWSFAIGLFVGALAGAAAASLLAPRSGQENREAVTERGVVLKNRVADKAGTVTSSVKETTNSAVATVKETTNSAVATVKETTSNAVASVKDTTSTVVTKVSDTAATVKEKASHAAEKVSETASSTVSKVQDVATTAVSKAHDVASTAAEKVQDVATTATEKARSLTGRGGADEIPVPTAPETLASEANYDAEDVRPVTTSAATQPSDPLATLHAIDTFEPTATAQEPGTLTDVLPTAEVRPELGTAIGNDVVGAGTVSGSTTAKLDTDKIAAINEAVAELSSDEQFEITDTGATMADNSATGTNSRSVGGSSANVREASEGADRGA